MKSQCSTTNSLTWRDFGWKSMIRYFITPKLKSKLTGIQHPCWRECGSTQVDHAHVLWLCPRIQPFWKNVGHFISAILGLNIDVSFSSLFLCVASESLCKGDVYLLKIFLVACKKAVAKCWLHPPTLDLFIGIVNYIRSMEKMTYTLRLQKNKGEKYWSKWVCYLGVTNKG